MDAARPCIMVTWSTPGIFRMPGGLTHGGHCMRLTRMTIVGLLSLSSGCGATLAQLQTRAALDLDCTPASITARDVDIGTMVASGCGKQAIYIEHCVGNNHSSCTWMLNSEIKSVASQ